MDDREILKIEYPANSNRAKREEKKEESKKVVQKIVSGIVVKRKKGLFKRMTETFFGEEVVNVKSYVIHDVLIPALKSTFSDMVTGGIEMILFPGREGSGRRRGGTKPYYVSYDKASRDRDKRDTTVRSRAKHDFDDIVLSSRGEAEEVLSNLVDLVEDYGVASIMDLYGFVGIEATYTDDKFGWTNLSSASVSRTRDGYMLNLPRALALD